MYESPYFFQWIIAIYKIVQLIEYIENEILVALFSGIAIECV